MAVLLAAAFAAGPGRRHLAPITPQHVRRRLGGVIMIAPAFIGMTVATVQGFAALVPALAINAVPIILNGGYNEASSETN